MNETRKKIIINEIEYWKKSRILPEKYCNFLLALYTEGEYEQEKQSSPTRQIKGKQYLFLSCMIVSALIVNYFTEIVPLMQISLFLIFLVTLVGLCYYEMKKNHPIMIPLIATAFILLLLTVKSYELFVPGKIVYLYSGLLLNCLTWVFVGYKRKLVYFIISGITGTFIIFYFIIKSVWFG